MATKPADGTDWWLRVRFDEDNGSGGTDVSYYKSTDDGATWTLMTTVTTASTTGIWEDTYSVGVNIGSTGGTALTSCRIYGFKVRHGFGTKTLNLLPIDRASMGSPTNNVTLAGSPSLIVENYSYPGYTTDSMRKDILGILQEETATAAGTITGDGNAEVIVTAAGMANSPKTVSVAVLNGDTATVWAGKVRVALAADPDVSAFFSVRGFGTSIQLKTLAPAANDSTMNISLDNDTCTGITTAATSSNTLAGREAHGNRLFGNNGDTIIFWHLGINDTYAGDYTSGSRWLEGLTEIISLVNARAPLATPCIVATNPKSTVTDLVNNHALQRWARASSYARQQGWGYVDWWAAIVDDGTALATLIPDGTHPSSDAFTNIINPLFTDAFDPEWSGGR